MFYKLSNGLVEVRKCLLTKVHLCYNIVTVEGISSYKCVNTRNIIIVNQTQPVLLCQPHLRGKHTLCAKIALRSFGANRHMHEARSVLL